jgi:hypothetical protein
VHAHSKLKQDLRNQDLLQHKLQSWGHTLFVFHFEVKQLKSGRKFMSENHDHTTHSVVKCEDEFSERGSRITKIGKLSMDKFFRGKNFYPYLS